MCARGICACQCSHQGFVDCIAITMLYIDLGQEHMMTSFFPLQQKMISSALLPCNIRMYQAKTTKSQLGTKLYRWACHQLHVAEGVIYFVVCLGQYSNFIASMHNIVLEMDIYCTRALIYINTLWRPVNINTSALLLPRSSSRCRSSYQLGKV